MQRGGALGREVAHGLTASGRVGLRYGVLMYAQLTRAGRGWVSRFVVGRDLALPLFFSVFGGLEFCMDDGWMDG